MKEGKGEKGGMGRGCTAGRLGHPRGALGFYGMVRVRCLSKWGWNLSMVNVNSGLKRNLWC